MLDAASRREFDVLLFGSAARAKLTGVATNPDFLQPAANIYSNPWQTPRYTRIALRLEF